MLNHFNTYPLSDSFRKYLYIRNNISKPPHVIRPYNSYDQARILQILKENTPTFFAVHEHKDLLHYLQNEIDHYFVLEEEGMVKGSGGYNFNKDDSISISWDLVDPKFQGKGIGGQLLNYRLKRIFKQHDPNKVIVRTSQLTFGFYTKFGFVVREVKKDYWSKGLDLYYMELVHNILNFNLH